jgi:protein gp37
MENVQLHLDRLEQPLRWRKPRVIFVNSMSDLFHEHVPLGFIVHVFDVMRTADRHVFQILTKRHERLAELAPEIDWPSNVWMGVTSHPAPTYKRDRTSATSSSAAPPTA